MSAKVSEAGSLREAIKTIILADVVMSLDNILAVGGAAEGHLWLLIFGLAFSIPILLLGSELVARLLGRLPILVYVGAVVLIITAVGMILEDDLVHDIHAASVLDTALVSAVVSAVIILFGLRAQRSHARAAAAATLPAWQHHPSAMNPDQPHPRRSGMRASPQEESDALPSPWSAAHAPPLPFPHSPAARPGLCLSGNFRPHAHASS